MSGLPPIATEKADMSQMVMSALPPKAHMCSAPAHVCFGPIADIRQVTHLVGAQRKRRTLRKNYHRCCFVVVAVWLPKWTSNRRVNQPSSRLGFVCGMIANGLKFRGAEGGLQQGSSRDVRLQPSNRQITACEGWRQTDHTRLWYLHARVCRGRRCRGCGLRPSRDGAFVFQRGDS